MLDLVRRHYPSAVSSRDYIRSMYAQLRDRFGLMPSDIMLAQSICSDDVNNIEYPEEGRAMLGPFNLGGLDGYPFTGLTGMSAFARHVPDAGAALIFYAPHIGMNRTGELGKILRVGQHVDSGCCGAALAALDKLQKGAIQPGPKSDYDYQQQTIEQLLYAQQERILGAEFPLREATEVIYEASETRIDELVAQTSFLGKYTLVMGAILINTDRETGSFLQLRRYCIFDTKTHQKIGELSF